MRQRYSSRRGATIVEFVLSVALIFVPLILGTIVIGMNIIRTIQVTQLARDAGHMFARGVDFSTAANRGILTLLAGGLDLGPDGKSVLYLSSILKVPADCGCANANKAVFTRQIRLGNTSLKNSAYGTPAVNADGTLTVSYYSSPSARAAAFDGTVMAMDSGEVAYVSESFYRSAELDMAGFMTGTGVAAKGIF